MDNKENIDSQDDLLNFSADSLMHESQNLPEVVDDTSDVNNKQNTVSSSSGTINQDEISPTNLLNYSTGPALMSMSSVSDSPAPTAGPAMREAVEYADDLARELINDTNPLVRSSDHSLDSDFLSILNESMPHPKGSSGDGVAATLAGATPAVEDRTGIEPARVGSEQVVESPEATVESENLDTIEEKAGTSAEPMLQEATNLLADSEKKTHETEMEFTKNYSDELLMGQNDRGTDSTADLADFELPPYSGSSSGSEQAPKQQQPSPSKRKLSGSSGNQASSSALSAQGAVSPPDLNAVKTLLLSSYSRVSHVFHWERPIESGVLFTIGITLIIALTFFSIISVVAYSALVIITFSGLIRIYKSGMKTLGRSSDTPFDHLWDKIRTQDVSLSPEKIHELVDSSHGNLNASLVYFKQVLLVEDKLATFKFALFVYLLSYIGAWFNGLTLITITYLGLYSVPLFYQINKTKIDEYLKLAADHASTVKEKVFGSTSGPGGETKKQK